MTDNKEAVLNGAPEVEAPPPAPKVTTANGTEVKFTEKSKKPYIMSPKQDDMVKLYWLQGHGPRNIAFNLGLPEKDVEAVIEIATRERLQKNQPLPERLGKPGANNTPPAGV